jgi:hypothetical protein
MDDMMLVDSLKTVSLNHEACQGVSLRDIQYGAPHA